MYSIKTESKNYEYQFHSQVEPIESIQIVLSHYYWTTLPSLPSLPVSYWKNSSLGITDVSQLSVVIFTKLIVSYVVYRWIRRMVNSTINFIACVFRGMWRKLLTLTACVHWSNCWPSLICISAEPQYQCRSKPHCKLCAPGVLIPVTGNEIDNAFGYNTWK